MQFQNIEKMGSFFSKARMLDDRCSGLFFKDFGRAALLGVILGLAIVLGTGCASMGGGVRAGLIAPVTNGHQNSAREYDDFYQAPRSPGYNDLTGS